MIKLITPPGMLFTTALLVIYAFYALMIGMIENSLPLLAGCAVSVVATYGVAMMRPWSRWLVYALSVGFFAKLGVSLYEGYTSGFFGFQFGNASEIAKSLAATSVMALLSCLCCWLVYRQFRPALVRAEPGINASIK